MTGFWTRTKSGNVAHINGDRKMSDETLAALHILIDAVYKQYGNTDKEMADKDDCKPVDIQGK